MVFFLLIILWLTWTYILCIATIDLVVPIIFMIKWIILLLYIFSTEAEFRFKLVKGMSKDCEQVAKKQVGWDWANFEQMSDHESY